MQETMQDTWYKFIRNIDEDIEPEAGPKRWSAIYDLISAASSAIIVVLLLFAFVFRAVDVSGDSMLPTLSDGDLLFVMSVSADYKKDDIVIITHPQEGNRSMVKRVIGVEGDVINIDYYTHSVYVNGEKLNEDYLFDDNMTEGDIQFPITVEKDTVFVLGDNRGNSTDSRHSVVGLVKKDSVVGVAKYRLLPDFCRIGKD